MLLFSNFHFNKWTLFLIYIRIQKKLQLIFLDIWEPKIVQNNVGIRKFWSVIFLIILVPSKFVKINILRQVMNHIDFSVKFSYENKPIKENVEYQTLQKIEIFGHFINCTNRHFLSMFNSVTFFLTGSFSFKLKWPIWQNPHFLIDNGIPQS